MAKHKQGQPKEETKQKWLDHYKPTAIKADAEHDYQVYKETGEFPKRDPAVIKRTVRLLVFVVIIFLVLGILILLQAIGG